MATQGIFFGQQPPTGLVIAQTVGITASMFLLGTKASLSLVAIPAAMQAPAPLAAQQWFTIFTRGMKMGPPLAIASALATGYLAYTQDRSSISAKLNLAATLLLPSIIPFTLAFLAPTNNKLLAKKDELASASLEDKAIEANVAEGENVHALMDRWATLNLARCVLVGAGALCTILGALSKKDIVGFREIGLASGANRMG
ncbi:hypothetical protein EJ02DRAFT_460258 [Clathrospora elynae]|uniref:DUF1772-domain-containing protein n=1 Tax=Clathrospora elynae TaxID=706981 RepID=A0A6A5S4N7_9PLEO|nr:hypothetical protein EJ02DRAFT_460258 [Clathrospora elynae]